MDLQDLLAWSPGNRSLQADIIDLPVPPLRLKGAEEEAESDPTDMTTITDTPQPFDSTAVTGYPSWPALAKAVNDVALEMDNDYGCDVPSRYQFVLAVYNLALTTYAQDNCQCCGIATAARGGEYAGGGMRFFYECPRQGWTWTCNYAPPADMPWPA